MLFSWNCDFLTELCPCCEATGRGSENSSRPIHCLTWGQLTDFTPWEYRARDPAWGQALSVNLWNQLGLIKLQRQLRKVAKRPPKKQLESWEDGWGEEWEVQPQLSFGDKHMPVLGGGDQRVTNPLSTLSPRFPLYLPQLRSSCLSCLNYAN